MNRKLVGASTIQTITICTWAFATGCQAPKPAASSNELIRLRDQLPDNYLQPFGRIKTLAWETLESITYPQQGVPVWSDWATEQEVLPPSPTPNPALKGRLILRTPSKSSPERESKLLSNGVHSFERIYFNDIAAAHIKSLGDQSVLVSLRNVGRREVEEFPVGSVILKAYWRFVPADGAAPAGLWDHDQCHVPPNYSLSTKLFETEWPQCARIMRPGTQGPDEAPCWPNETRSPIGKRVSMASFFTLPVTNPKEASSMLEAKNAVGLGDLALLGLHITTKEIPDWSWATFWWKPESLQKEWDHKGRTARLNSSPIWRNYASDAAVSLTQPSEFCSPTRRKRSFNPYIEGSLSGGLLSNCLECHRQAQLQNSLAHPMQIDNAPPNYAQVEGRLLTDFIWSLGLRAR